MVSTPAVSFSGHLHEYGVNNNQNHVRKDPECARNYMPRRLKPCAVCDGPYAEGRCWLNPGCLRNSHSRREIFGRRHRRRESGGASSSAPLAADPGQPASAARRRPLWLYLADPGDATSYLHRTRTQCLICARQRVVGHPRALCPCCGTQRRSHLAGRWVVDDRLVHTRWDCAQLNRRSSDTAY